MSNHPSQGSGLKTNVGEAVTARLGGANDQPVVQYTVPQHKRFGGNQPHSHSGQNQSGHVGGYRPEFRKGRYDQKREDILGQVNLVGVEKILVSFSFFEETNLALIPNDITVTEAFDAKKILGDGYRDSGVQLISTHNIGTGFIRRGVVNQGFYLSDVRATFKMENDPKLRSLTRKKIKVTMEFLRGDGTATKLKRPLTEYLRMLAGIIWQDCFVWDNTGKAPDAQGEKDLSVTVNCRSPLHGCRATKALVIREHLMQVVDQETEDEKS